MLPPRSPQRPPGASRAPRGRAEIITDMGRASAPRPGPPGGFLAPDGALGIAKGNALGSGPGGAWRIGWVGVAHATGKCALVHKVGFRPPRTPPDEELVRCRAEPDRRGRVGVAHAIRICALVHNISQAWGSNPPARSIFKGLGNTQRQGRIRGPSLGRAQRPSCLTTPASSLSCHRSPRRRSPRPSGHAPAQPSGRPNCVPDAVQPALKGVHGPHLR